jgi:hypothetical protein
VVRGSSGAKDGLVVMAAALQHDLPIFERSFRRAMDGMFDECVQYAARARDVGNFFVRWRGRRSRGFRRNYPPDNDPTRNLVPLTGLEPVTPALRMRCSTN